MGKRAEAQMGLVVVNEACGNDDMEYGGRQLPWVHHDPHSPWKGLETSRGAFSARVPKPPKKGMVVVRVQGGMVSERVLRAPNRRQ